MTHKIFKYLIPPILNEETILDLYSHTTFCEAYYRDGLINLWCEVNLNSTMLKRYFKIFKTGEELPDLDNLFFLKTIIHPEIETCHLFEVRKRCYELYPKPKFC